MCCLDLPVTNAFSSCPLSPVTQGLTLTTFVLQTYKPMVEKRRNTVPPITPTKIWTFGEVLFSVLDSGPEPDAAFFSGGVSFGTGEGGERGEGFSCGARLRGSSWSRSNGFGGTGEGGEEGEGFCCGARLRASSWSRCNGFGSCSASRPRLVLLPSPICL